MRIDAYTHFFPKKFFDRMLTIAGETGWGYTRVLGDLRKLTSLMVSRQTVANVMRAHGLDPGPKRGEKTGDEFVRGRHPVLPTIGSSRRYPGRSPEGPPSR